MNDIAHVENPFAKRTFLLGKDIVIKGKDAKKGDILDISKLNCTQVELMNNIRKVRPYGLINAELQKYKDHLHERKSGMNHILFAKLHELGVPYLLNLSIMQEPVVMGRMMQNIMLARKAGATIKVVTCAKTKNGCASRKDIEGLLRIMGMDSKAILHAFL